MSKIVTFDFDNTIAMSHIDLSSGKIEYIFEGYNTQIINLIKKHIIDGNNVYIITARTEDKEKLFPNNNIRAHLDRLSLSHYFQDSRIHYTNGAPKLQTLKKLGSTLHYDDNMQEHIDNYGGIPIKHPYDFYPDTEHVAKAVIFDMKDNILILKRVDKQQIWDIPGGHLKNIEVNRGTDGFEEGLEREVAEETGLILPFAKQIGNMDFTWKEKNSKITMYLSKFETLKPNVNLNLQDHMENSEYRWVSLANIDKYAQNGTKVMQKAVEIAKKHGILTEESRYQLWQERNHSRMKKKLVGMGKNKHFGGGKGHSRPKMSRSKSAPAGFGVLEEENEGKKHTIRVKIVPKRPKKGDFLP